MAQLQIIPILNPDKNKLEEAYEVAIDLSIKRGQTTVRVPKFFQYDGASVPAPMWQVIGTPFNPRFMIPSVFHDWLYHTHLVKKKEADDLFGRLLIDNGVSKTRAWLMATAVEAAGDAYWENDPDDSAYMKRLAKRITDDGRTPEDYGIKLS